MPGSCLEKGYTKIAPSHAPVARYFPSGLKQTAMIQSSFASKFRRTLNTTNQLNLWGEYPENLPG